MSTKRKTIHHTTFSQDATPKDLIICDLKFFEKDGVYSWEIMSPTFSSSKEAVENYNKFIEKVRKKT